MNISDPDQQAYVVNANSGQVDIIDASNPAMPSLSASLDIAGDVAPDVLIAVTVPISSGIVLPALGLSPNQPDLGFTKGAA